jgi:signal transduction histidine kinase
VAELGSLRSSAVARRNLVSRLRKGAARWGDVGLAIALTTFVQIGIWTDDGYLTGSKTVFAFTSLLMTGPLVWRRRFPVAVTLVVAGAILLQAAVEHGPHPPDGPFLAWIVAAYSVAVHAELRPSLGACAVLVIAVDVWAYETGDDLVFIPIILTGFWLAGRIVRSRNLLAAELAERTRELEQEREERTRLAVAEERTRIARELHDLVAHTLGVMVVQAGAERLHEQPGTPAYDALSSIERSGRQALVEMARLVGMLRAGAESDALGPQPGLDQLDALVARVREAGLQVDLVVEGDAHELAPGLDLSAYRIVQEALTNTLRHARSMRARVLLRWEPSTLHIEVADDGVGPPAEPARVGHGLIGIRERVALFVGALVTGRSEWGGYLLAATLQTSK